MELRISGTGRRQLRGQVKEERSNLSKIPDDKDYSVNADELPIVI